MTTTNSTSKETSTEKPAETTAADVAKISGQLVAILQGLSPQMQIRALGATATLLGIDKEQRRSGTQQQQRTTNGNSQNRSGNR